MKAIRVHSHGGAEVLVPGQLEKPSPGPGEALVKVEATGLNFVEVYYRTGLYKPAAGLPYTPGGEGAGTVEAVGSGVTSVRPGDRVASVNLAGSYAEWALAPADKLVVVPDKVTTKQAAAAMLQGMTAHYLAITITPLAPGDTCVVHAAAGGVGLLLCQIAKRRGARVIGTVSTAGKAALARAAGADDVILYMDEDFAARTMQLTEGKGVRVVYDSVGKTTFDKSVSVLAPRGMMALYGQSSGPVPPFDPAVLAQRGSLFLTRPSLFHYVANREELLARAGDVLGWVADGSLKVRIDREIPLENAAEAHRLLEERKTTGKVLLIP
jgi:NADPH2:quinone reductase